MPKIKSYTPRWLTDPADGGHKLFAPSLGDVKPPPLSSRKAEPGPRRTIARRGTEVFVANGKELKWGDLVYLRDGWEAKQARSPRRFQVKREESSGSLGASNGITNGEGRSAEGFRVGGRPNECPSPATDPGARLSRRPWPTTSGSSSCRPWQTTWPCLRPTRCIYACFPTHHT